VGIDLLDRIAGSIALKTWPELVDVPTIPRIVDTSGKSNQDAYAHIYLEPSAALPDHWYALSVDAVPAGVTWQAFATMAVITSGAHVSRFRVGPGPIVAGVLTYSKGPGWIIYVEFSEPVIGDLQLVGASYAGGGSLDCKVDGTPVPRPPANAGVTPPNAAMPTGNDSAFLTCTSLDLGRPIQIDIQPGLSATAGPALNGGSPVRIIIDPSEWIDLPDGSKFFRAVP